MWFDILKTNQYMVKNSIWNDAFGHYNAGAFSINELERELGRKLTAEDFSFTPMNMSYELQGHIGKNEFNKMLELFKNEQYQIDSLEEWGNQDIASLEGSRDFFRQFLEEHKDNEIFNDFMGE